jgi:alanyl-tRNA synthetase
VCSSDLYVSGDRALEVREEHEEILKEAARKLGVPPAQLPQGIDRLLGEVDESRKILKARTREDLGATAARLLADPDSTETHGEVTITRGLLELDREGLQELSRLLTREPGRVALLAGEREGKGTLFVGSSAPQVAAAAVVEAAKAKFGGRGGGNPSAATALGEPGRPLAEALEAARHEARKEAGS